MQMKPQDLIKAIVAGVGELVDARVKTLEINIKGEMNALEKRQNKKFETINKRFNIIDKRFYMVQKDIHNLQTEITKKLIEHEKRIEKMQQTIGVFPKH